MNNSAIVVRKDIFIESEGTSLAGKNDFNGSCESTCESEQSEHINIVYIDMPQLCLDDNIPIILSDDNLKIRETSQVNDMPAIFIEVPQVTAEETVAYTELSNMIVNSSTEETTGTQKTDSVHTTDGDIPVTKIIPAADRNEDSKNCYIIQNGSNGQPLYIVKNKELLEKEKNNDNFCNKSNDNSEPGFGCKREARSDDRFCDTSNNEDLMWLLNFKLDNILSNCSSIFHPLDDVPNRQSSQTHANKSKDDIINCDSKKGKQNCDQQSDSSKSQFSSKAKPPFTYTELIECALQQKGPLTVSEIYQWISESFPYYKSWDDRWKNSVRHNLSINPYFRKGSKARQGSGHLWTVSKSAEKSKGWSWKRQRYLEYEELTKKTRMHNSMDDDVKEAALAAANIEDKENRGLHRDVLFATHNHAMTLDVSMEQTAEEILSGVKREVEVEFLDTSKIESSGGNDFLNPISKEILMGECGFLNQIELNLTAETTDHLGIAESEQVFELPEDLGFQYTDAATQNQQLLSLVN